MRLAAMVILMLASCAGDAPTGMDGPPGSPVDMASSVDADAPDLDTSGHHPDPPEVPDLTAPVTPADLAGCTTATGVACTGDGQCCLEPLGSGTAQGEYAYCSAAAGNVCCSTWLQYGAPCSGGHFRSCTACGQGVQCSGCN